MGGGFPFTKGKNVPIRLWKKEGHVLNLTSSGQPALWPYKLGDLKLPRSVLGQHFALPVVSFYLNRDCMLRVCASNTTQLHNVLFPSSGPLKAQAPHQGEADQGLKCWKISVSGNS